jgi:hypothetical protein
MDIKLVGELKRVKTETGKGGRKSRRDIYLAGCLKVGSKELPVKIHAVSDDGSIKANRGKYYVYFETEAKKLHPHQYHVACQACEKTVAPGAAKALFPAIEKVAGVKLAKWSGKGGWSLFDVKAVMLPDKNKLISARRVGPEVVALRYEQEVDCPVHGVTTYIDTDVMD